LITYWLSPHLGYACRHSGACCTARWPIPIERERAAAVQAAIDQRQVTAPAGWYRAAPDSPGDAVGVLALQRSGDCVFYRPLTVSEGRPASRGACVIHRWRPQSCEHFPHVCVIDPRGIHVTLSHFCPTAASLLFDAGDRLRIVAGPAVLGDARLPEGLDASDALPPADATGRRLLSWDEVAAFERALVERVAADRCTPPAPSPEAFERVRSAVLPEWSWPETPPEVEAGWNALVAPAWPHWVAVVGRYLAAKAHASWSMHLGDGPAAVERHVDLARTVLQVEVVRACLTRGVAADRAAVVHAIRQSDLLLVHLADPSRLASA
jgi:Fe-S-cluster containining protein